MSSENDAPAELRLRDFWVAGLIAAGSWAVALWFLPQLPERVPVHWGVDGKPDDWGSRAFAVWLWPIILSAMVPLFALLPRIDPRRRNYAQFRGAYLVLIPLVMGMMLGFQVLTMRASLDGGTIDIGRWIGIGTGLLFLVLGTILPSLKPNWFIGIRTPWTLEDDRVWQSSHRFGGRVFVVLGLTIALVGGFASNRLAFLVMMAGIFGATLVIVLHSLIVYRRLRAADGQAAG